MRQQLTDVSVRSMKPTPGKQLKVWDTRTLGFGIRINDTSKSWFVMYGRARTLKTLGRYPEVSLADARRKALVLLGTRPEASTAPTFPDAREAFCDQHDVSPRQKAETKRLLTKHFKWTTTIDKLTHRDVAAAVDAIPKKSEALHALKAVRTFFNWCVPRHIPYSPAQGVKPPQRYIPRTRILTDDELKATWHASDRSSYPFNVIAKLLILTGQRRSEIGLLKWSDISGDAATLATNKSGVPHIFFLSETAQTLIRTLPRSTSPYLFFNSRDYSKPYQGWAFHKEELDQLSGVRGTTIHDWRRTFASGLQRLGVKLEVTEAILGHVSGKVSGIVRVYQTHDYADEKRAAIKLWDAHCTKLFSPPSVIHAAA